MVDTQTYPIRVLYDRILWWDDTPRAYRWQQGKTAVAYDISMLNGMQATGIIAMG